jgi:enterochelin esterase-like enzyme
MGARTHSSPVMRERDALAADLTRFDRRFFPNVAAAPSSGLSQCKPLMLVRNSRAESDDPRPDEGDSDDDLAAMGRRGGRPRDTGPSAAAATCLVMSLTGWPFLTLVVAATVVAFTALVVRWPALAGRGVGSVSARVAMLLLVNALVLFTAATQLNAQFLFFADWADLGGALGGHVSSTSLTRGTSASRAAATAVRGPHATAGRRLPPLPKGASATGGVISYTVKGPLSGIVGNVLVQLPPGYANPALASARYPVLETFHGYPGSPGQWNRSMHLGAVMAQQVAARHLAPTLVVSPQMEVPAGVDTECVNGHPGLPQLETWLAQDIPNWVTHTFRVQTQRDSWATIGLSTGGWCAAMATMLHPAQYSAAIVMGGYFRPKFGAAYEPYPPTSPLTSHYDLVALTKRTPPPVAVWLETSHADSVSYKSSAALLKATKSPLAVDATVLLHTGHRISLWRQLLPGSLTWLGANVPGFKPR